MARQDSRPQLSVRLDLAGGRQDREKIAAFANSRQWVVLEGGSLPYPVTLSVGVGDDGRLRCTGVILGAFTAEPAEITSASLREVRISELLQEIARTGDLLESLIEYTGPRAGRPFLDRLSPGLIPDLPPRPPRVRGALPRSHFETVAAEYRRALVKNERAPMAEVRRCLANWLEREEIPEPTVRRWVQRARDMGLLGSTTPGKAGDRPSPAGTSNGS
jgi:hypothetical protein